MEEVLLPLDNGEILSGKVWFVGDDGVVLSTLVATDSQNNPVTTLQIIIFINFVFQRNKRIDITVF